MKAPAAGIAMPSEAAAVTQEGWTPNATALGKGVCIGTSQEIIYNVPIKVNHLITDSSISDLHSEEEEDDYTSCSSSWSGSFVGKSPATVHTASKGRMSGSRRYSVPRPMTAPRKKDPKPTPQQIEQWKQAVRDNLQPDEKKDAIMLSMAMSCRSSRKLTVWERMVTPFFVASRAIDTNPFQFLTRTSNAAVVTIPPNKLQQNRWKIPQRANLSTFMETSLMEAHSIVTSRYQDRARIIEEGTDFFGIELGTMAPFGSCEDLRKCMNFTTNTLHQLWHAQVGSEEEDKQVEVVRWMKENLSQIAQEEKFEAVWKERVNSEMEKKFLSMKGHDRDHIYYGNWRKKKATAKAVVAKKAKAAPEGGPTAAKAAASKKAKAAVQAAASQKAGPKRKKSLRSLPLSNAGPEPPSKRGRKEKANLNSSDNEGDPASENEQEEEEQNTADDKSLSQGEDEEDDDPRNQVDDNSDKSLSQKEDEEDQVDDTSEDSLTQEEHVEDEDSSSSSSREGINQGKESPELDSPGAEGPTEGQGNEEEEEESDFQDSDGEITENEEEEPAYPEDNVELPPEGLEDAVTMDLLNTYTRWCGSMPNSKGLREAARRGLKFGSVMESHHYYERKRGEVESYSPPSWIRNDPSDKLKHSQGGHGFVDAGKASIKCISMFLTACEMEDFVPPRWRWDHKLFSEMGTLETSDVALKNRSMLVCLVLSAATRDQDCIEATANLHRKGLLHWSKLRRKRNYAAVKGAIKKCGIYKKKAKFLREIAVEIETRFKGKIPTSAEELQSMLGIGRKTAVLHLNEALGLYAGIGVDSHVREVSISLGLLEKIDGGYPNQEHTEASLRTWVADHWCQRINRLFGSLGQMLSQSVGSHAVDRMAVAAQCFHREEDVQLFWTIVSLVRRRYTARKNKSYPW